MAEKTPPSLLLDAGVSARRHPVDLTSPFSDLSGARVVKVLDVVAPDRKPLGNRSSSAPGIPFEEGGGAVWKIEHKVKLTKEEAVARHAKKLRGWEKSKPEHQALNPKPTLASIEEEEKHVLDLEMELHPGGGFHSNNRPGVGSYLKGKGKVATPEGNLQNINVRVGRLGAFGPHQTFDLQKPNRREAERNREHAVSPARRRVPPLTTSPEPDMASAAVITTHMLRNPTRVIEELRNKPPGEPYGNVARRLTGDAPAVATTAPATTLQDVSEVFAQLLLRREPPADGT